MHCLPVGGLCLGDGLFVLFVPVLELLLGLQLQLLAFLLLLGVLLLKHRLLVLAPLADLLGLLGGWSGCWNGKSKPISFTLTEILNRIPQH